MPPTSEQVTDFMFSSVENVKVYENGTHFHGRCPFCGDSKKSKSKKRFHLYFSSTGNIGFICYNCDITGNFYKLYAHIGGITSKEAWKKFNKFDKNNIQDRLNNKKPKTQPPQEQERQQTEFFEDFSYILNNCVSSTQQVDGIMMPKYQKTLKNFVNKRGITDRELYYYYGDGLFSHRIIIPIWYYDKMVYFQARRTNKNQEPKYLNPSVNKSNIILNINRFSKDKYICITEGILDAYSIGDQGTTMLGKEINSDFIDTVSDHTDKGIVIIMDNDKDGIVKLKEIIEQYKDRFLYFLMPYKHRKYKDINDIYVNFSNINIYEYIMNNVHTWRKTEAKLIYWEEVS